MPVMEIQTAESALGAEENGAPISAPFSKPNRKTIKTVSKEYDVSPKMTERAKALANASPELADKVKIAEIRLVDAEKEAKRTKKPAKEVLVSAEEYDAALARIEERCSTDFLAAIEGEKIPGLKESSDIVAFSLIENKKKMGAVERDGHWIRR